MHFVYTHRLVCDYLMNEQMCKHVLHHNHVLYAHLLSPRTLSDDFIDWPYNTTPFIDTCRCSVDYTLL